MKSCKTCCGLRVTGPRVGHWILYTGRWLLVSGGCFWLPVSGHLSPVVYLLLPPDTGYSMLDIAIPQVQIFLSFIEYRESNIEYLLAKSSGAGDQ